MVHKDKVVVHNPDESVEYVPVADYGTGYRATEDEILKSMGSRSDGKDTKGSEEQVEEWEGYVPPSNRDGDTAQEDSQLGLVKQELLRAHDAVTENSSMSGSVDPRDNPNAPDKREKAKSDGNKDRSVKK